MSKKPVKNLGGRPLIQIDWKAFDSLCRIQCTLVEIASFFQCSEDTIERAVKREFNQGFADIYKSKSAGGKASLRRLQFKAAEDGNTTMLVWLGKQYLGQRDKFDTELSGKDGGPIQSVSLTVNEFEAAAKKLIADV